jgi:hypothetical protein
VRRWPSLTVYAALLHAVHVRRLQSMGFKLEASEAARLLEQLDITGSGRVGKVGGWEGGWVGG